MTDSKLYCVRMSVKSPQISWPIKGDMVWGFLMSFLASSDVDKFNDVLSEKRTLVVSSGFPEGRLPMPLSVPEFQVSLSKDEYVKMKNKKKEKYTLASTYLSGISCEKKSEGGADKGISTTTTHVSVSRETGAAIEGMLFSNQEFWMVGAKLDFYVYTNFSAEELKILFNESFALGFGKKSSVGYGVLEVVEDGVFEVNQKENSQREFHQYMALGPFAVPEECKIEDLNANIFVRFGKLGRNVVNTSSPYKVPVIMFEEGATFTSKEKLYVVGSVFENVKPDCEFNIRHSAITPVIEM